LPNSFWDMDATAFVNSVQAPTGSTATRKSRWANRHLHRLALLEGSRILNVLARYPSLAGKKRLDLRGMVTAALSYETVVFGRLAGSTACAVGIRLAVPFRSSLADLLEAIVVDVLRWLLRVRLFHKRDHGSRSLVSG
jgi:hypothetical protein